MARIIGRFPSRSTDDTAARDALLAEVIAQNEAIGESLKSRRGTVDDVDPDTGEPVTTPPVAAAPVSTPTPGDATAA